MTEIFLGRQPILDASSKLFAYELLFRGGAGDAAVFDDENQASASVVRNTFIEIGLENVVGRHQAFVRMTQQFMEDELYRPLPPRRTVLLMSPHSAPDAVTLAALTKAAQQGYKLALSSVGGEPVAAPLLDLATYVKVDCLGRSSEQMSASFLQLRDRRLTIIADRVETLAEFSELSRIGYRYFKGYYFCKPDVMRHHSVPANRVALMELLARVRDPNVPMQQIQELIERNVSISYRILRFVNSALYSFPRHIESIRHATALLGLERVRDCLTLSLLANLDEKPHELAITALVRARTCQLLARSTGNQRESVFFSAGLLSVLDGVLDTPMSNVVDVMGLAPELKEALLHHEGPAGHALRAALGCESATLDSKALRVFGAAALRSSHVHAIKWVSELDQAMSGARDEEPEPVGR